MAEEQDNSQKTEDPTQKRLEEARKKGDIAKSQDVPIWFLMMASAAIMAGAGPLAAMMEGNGIIRADSSIWEVHDANKRHYAYTTLSAARGFCDMAAMAGLTPASVICEIMNDDGTMARLPDLEQFAAEHGLKIGTIADLIEHRSRHESLVRKAGERDLQTAQGRFRCTVWQDKWQGVHLTLSHGDWKPGDEVLVRVHEPLSLMDVLDVEQTRHSWPVADALSAIQASPAGVAVFLNCGETAARLLERFDAAPQGSQPPTNDLRTYGTGAQILRALGVNRMKLLGSPRRMPSMAGYGLEITGFTTAPAA